ncbi:MAG: hypothetical protein K8R54_03605 [Bacteroidales bacterium]|nr:hypothetical protein [Bacteroidales bacterium]
MNNYKRGSIWRKWDLHIHCPSTVFNNQFEGVTIEDKWEKYINEIEKLDDISVLGITDYFSIKGYTKMLEFKNKGKFSNIDLLLPNVELRIIPVTDKKKAINLHIIFSPDIVDELDSLFFNNIEFEYAENTYKCTETDLIKLGRDFKGNKNLIKDKAYEEGCNQFKTGIKQLREIFNKNKKLRDNAITAVSNSNKDGSSGIQHSSLAATRQEIYRFSEFIFSGNPNDSIFFTGRGIDITKKIIKDYGSLKPCVHGSDAHSLNDICKPVNDRYTWIKADPTFDGLKQIVYEPYERVNVQKENPGLEFTKPFFNEVNIQKNIKIFEDESEHLTFEKFNLPLNPNLVSIIGGRGEGKSILVDFIAKGFNFSEKEYQNSDKFNISYNKSNKINEIAWYNFSEKHNLDFLYIRQNEVKDIALKPKELGMQIRRMLNIENISFSKNIQNEIDDIIDKIKTKLKWFEETNENGIKINNKTSLSELRKKNNDLLSSITNKENQEKLEKFTKNITSIQQAETKKEKLINIIDTLNDFSQKTNKTFNQIDEKIPKIDFKLQLEIIDKIKDTLTLSIKKYKDTNEEIKNKFAEIYKGDLTTLLSNADKYKRAIETIDNRFILIEEQEKDFLDLQNEKINIADKILNELNNHVNTIDIAWNNLLEVNIDWSPKQRQLIKKILSERDITVKGSIFFDTKQFYNGIRSCINGRRWKGKNNKGEVENHFQINDYISYCDFLKNRMKLELDKSGYYYDIKRFENYFYNLEERNEYLYVLPKITYKGKTLDKISVGQRGTVYLCLKLATNTFSTPIIFDQPEDDLDNQFIINELIDIFKELKKFRQVIIVTHNANLVVNADTEQIIIANNSDESLNYYSGSLENPKIINKVCEILEGGKQAFEKRNKKYKLVE